MLFDGRDVVELRTPRVTGLTVHGTGCTLAAAVAAALAHGRPVAEAAADAQRFVAGALRHAVAAGPAGRVLDPCWRAERRGS